MTPVPVLFGIDGGSCLQYAQEKVRQSRVTVKAIMLAVCTYRGNLFSREKAADVCTYMPH